MRRIIGNAILGLGAGMTTYGAIAFWLLQGHPPNREGAGRPANLYVLFIGMTILLVGAVVRDLRLTNKKDKTTD